MTQKAQAERLLVLAQAAKLRAGGGIKGEGLSTVYEQMKIRLMLCGLTGYEYEDALRELRVTLGL